MSRSLWALVATVVLVGVLLVAGFPFHTYLQQRHSLAQASQQLDQLSRQDRSLRAQIDQLQTNGQVEQLARRVYHLVKPGEQAYAILPLPQAPRAPSHRPRPADQALTRPAPPTHQGLWQRIVNEFSF